MAAPATRKKRPPSKPRSVAGQVVEQSAPPEAVEEGDGAAALDQAAGGFRSDGSYETRVIGQEGATPNPMVPVFEIGGTVYSIPEKPNPMVTMQFQLDLRAHGRDIAVGKFAKTLLGEEAVQALASSPYTTEEDVAHVMGRVMKVGFEGIERLRKKSSPLVDPS